LIDILASESAMPFPAGEYNFRSVPARSLAIRQEVIHQFVADQRIDVERARAEQRLIFSS
jgi:hypothetical protein